eukprot:gene2113-2522_t
MEDYRDAIEQVSLSVPWLPVAAAEWAVAHNKGNVDLAIEQLIALGDAAYHLSSDNVHHTSASTSHLPEVEPRSQSSASETVLTSQSSKPEGRSSSSSSNGAGTVSANAKTASMSKKEARKAKRSATKGKPTEGQPSVREHAGETDKDVVQVQRLLSDVYI